MRADQIHTKNILKSFCVCVSLLLNFNLKDMDAPTELVKTWHLGIRKWAFPYKSTGSHYSPLSICCDYDHLPMLQSFHLRFQFLSRPSVACKVEGSSNSWSSNTSTTSRIQNPQHGKQTKIHSFLTLPSLLANTCSASHKRTANFSALSGWKACTALSAKGKANAALPGHSQSWAKLKAASAKHRKQLQCKVFTSQSEIQLDCQQVNKSVPKNTHQNGNVRLEEPAPTQTALYTWTIITAHAFMRISRM